MWNKLSRRLHQTNRRHSPAIFFCLQQGTCAARYDEWMKRLTNVDAAYLAALIDGEGTVTLSRVHLGQMRYLVVSVCNNERPIIDWVQSTTGVGHVTRKRRASLAHGENFTWRIASRRALHLLERITPYMLGYKRLRAELALAEYVAVTPRNGKYTREILSARAEFERRFFLLKPRQSGHSDAGSVAPT